MEIVLKKKLDNDEKQQIRQLLQEADEEFVPPLSSRNGSRENEFTTGTLNKESGLADYYEKIINQSFIMAKENKEILGFMTYRTNYNSEPLQAIRDSFYITTLIVAGMHRGRKITKKLYAAIKTEAGKDESPVATRTWSTNDSHNRILQGMGFEVAAVIKDHRGPGVDTIYYYCSCSD